MLASYLKMEFFLIRLMHLFMLLHTVYGLCYRDGGEKKRRIVKQGGYNYISTQKKINES